MCDVEYIAESAARQALAQLNNAVEENVRLKERVRALEADIKRRETSGGHALTEAWARAAVEGSQGK